MDLNLATAMVCHAGPTPPLPKSCTRRLRYAPGETVEAMLRHLDCSAHQQQLRGAGVCIPAKIPSDPTLVNLDSVAKACGKLGLQAFGHQAQELFRTLARDAVRESELKYATFCTAKSWARARCTTRWPTSWGLSAGKGP